MCVCVYIYAYICIDINSSGSWKMRWTFVRFIRVMTHCAAKDVLSPISPTAPKSATWHYCCFSPSLLKAFYRRLNLNVHFCCSWPCFSQVGRLTLNATTTICWLSEKMFMGIFPCGLIWFQPEIHAPFFGWHPENTCDFSFWNTLCSLLHADLGVKQSVGKWVTSAWEICHNDSENYRIKCTCQHYNKKRTHLFSPSSAWHFLLQSRTPLTPRCTRSTGQWATARFAEHSQVMDTAPFTPTEDPARQRPKMFTKKAGAQRSGGRWHLSRFGSRVAS